MSEPGDIDLSKNPEGQMAPWCGLCDRPHQPCEPADLSMECVSCYKRIDGDEATDELGDYYHPECLSRERARTRDERRGPF